MVEVEDVVGKRGMMLQMCFGSSWLLHITNATCILSEVTCR